MIALRRTKWGHGLLLVQAVLSEEGSGGSEVKSLECHSVRFSSSFRIVSKEAACQMLGAMPILGRVFLAIDEGSLGSTLEHF